MNFNFHSNADPSNYTCGGEPVVLFIEPFYGGSHKVLIDNLLPSVGHFTLVTLSAKKWHWRARCAALSLYPLIPKITTERILFCSSVLNLAELMGMRPDLHKLKKIVYFHENQLIYPVQKMKERDVQYGYNQITTCLAADVVLFNSHFNKESFLSNIKNIIKLLPDYKPKSLRLTIEEKCHVIYFPVTFPRILNSERPAVLQIVWPHRWEFDKGPDDFFQVLFKLKHNGHVFQVAILGENFCDNPDIFTKAKETLTDEIVTFGYVEKEEYYRILCTSHVVISTARHEFFGVAMLEAVYCGCFPLTPNNLVYPEIYPKQCLFGNTDELYEMLVEFCLCPTKALEERKQMNIDFDKYSSRKVIPNFINWLIPET